jgi:hypothetical protein
MGLRALARVAFLLCAAWPIAMGVMFFATAKAVPTINIRWVAQMSEAQRLQAEHDLSVVWQQARERRTVRYFLIDADRANLRRIVTHPLVEDTAYINRGTLVLEDAPPALIWGGNRFSTGWPLTLLYASLIGCVICAALILRGR